MRIVSHWFDEFADVNPCEIGFDQGEFEDYAVLVEALDPCSGTPDGGTAALSASEGGPFELHGYCFRI